MPDTGFDLAWQALPIGPDFSQELGTVYLQPVDRSVLAHRACGGYLRYADDIFVFLTDGEAGEDVLARMATPADRLGLA